MSFSWNPVFDNQIAVGHEENGGLSIGMGGLTIQGATLQLAHPPQVIYGWRFGYIQTLIKAKVTWYYNNRSVKTVKRIDQPTLDGPGTHQFWYTPPKKVETVLTNPMSIIFPKFRDYPRTYGVDTRFSAVQGLVRFSVWAAYADSDTKIHLLKRLNWCIRYDVCLKGQDIAKGVEGKVGLDSFGNTLTKPVLTGGRAEDVQIVKTYTLSGTGAWEEQEDDGSSSGSSEGSDLEVIPIDWSQIKAPSWFK